MVCRSGSRSAITSGSAVAVRPRQPASASSSTHRVGRAGVAARRHRAGRPATRVTTAGPVDLDRDQHPVVEPGHGRPAPRDRSPSARRSAGVDRRPTPGRPAAGPRAAASRGARSRPSGDAGRTPGGRRRPRGPGRRPAPRAGGPRRSRPTRPGRRPAGRRAAASAPVPTTTTAPAGLGHRLVGADRQPAVAGHHHGHGAGRGRAIRPAAVRHSATATRWPSMTAAWARRGARQSPTRWTANGAPRGPATGRPRAAGGTAQTTQSHARCLVGAGRVVLEGEHEPRRAPSSAGRRRPSAPGRRSGRSPWRGPSRSTSPGPG